MLNAEATGFTKGMAHPGYFYVTPNGTVKEKFFETAYTERDTAASLILKLFPELVEGNVREVAAPYIKLTLAQSDEAVIPEAISPWRLKSHCRRTRMFMLPKLKDTNRSN